MCVRACVRVCVCACMCVCVHVCLRAWVRACEKGGGGACVGRGEVIGGFKVLLLSHVGGNRH